MDDKSPVHARAWKVLDFERTKQDLIGFLESKDNALMVLASSLDGRVLARTVLIANRGLDVYFFTWNHSRKCHQIQRNPRVALCKDRVQIEGTAAILGGLYDPAYWEYAEILRGRFPEAVALWKDRPGMVIVEVRPIKVVIGGEAGEEPHLVHLDLENKTAHSERWAHYA